MRAAPDMLPITPRSEAGVLALNNAHAAELSWLTAARLSELVGEAYWARRIGDADAFLIGFDQSARYDSPNFLWFRERYERFVYVDRVAVAGRARGRGLARLLYQALFDHAVRDGHSLVACEVNAMPPNPASDAFHLAMGFTIVGEAALAADKSVRYYVRAIGQR